MLKKTWILFNKQVKFNKQLFRNVICIDNELDLDVVL